MKFDTHLGFDGADASESRPENAPRRVQSLTLGWTDPDTGDRLTAQVRGAEDWLPELQRQGFELLGVEPLEVGPDAQGAHAGELGIDADDHAAPSGIGGEVSVVSQLAAHARRHVSRRN